MTRDQRPTISLIIPAYNEEDYLPACLDAVMANLAGKLHEIIVVDNNSTDRTREVVERYPAVTYVFCLLYTSPSPRDRTRSRMPSSA